MAGEKKKRRLGEEVADTTIVVRVDDARDQLYLHMNVIEVMRGEKILSVESGAGLGGDFIIIEYFASNGKRYRGICYAREIAREWIRAIDEGADPKLLESLTINRSETNG